MPEENESRPIFCGSGIPELCKPEGDGDDERQVQPGSGESKVASSSGVLQNTRIEDKQEDPNSEFKRFTDQDLKILDEVVSKSVKEGFISYNALRIGLDYPKSYKVFTDYLKDKAQGKASEEEVIAIMLYSARTMIFNFFDDQDLQVIVNFNPKNRSWYYTVYSNQGYDSYDAYGYLDRPKCEVDAFERAFAVLEKQLNSKI